MHFDGFEFGSIRIDGQTYEHDVVIDNGAVRRRKKKRSKQYSEAFGHTPLSLAEDLPWTCERLVVGSGAVGALPVMDEVKREARRRSVELVVVPTAKAISVLEKAPSKTNAVLHVTC